MCKGMPARQFQVGGLWEFNHRIVLYGHPKLIRGNGMATLFGGGLISNMNGLIKVFCIR